MRVLGKSILIKLKKKNIGNKRLCDEIDRLIIDLQRGNTRDEMTAIRKDADCVHSTGYYFFNIHIHRSLVFISVNDENLAEVIWAGSHTDYERIFKNNKATIESWLKKYGHIK